MSGDMKRYIWLKYHCLHHSDKDTNFCISMPLFDALGNALNKKSWQSHKLLSSGSTTLSSNSRCRPPLCSYQAAEWQRVKDQIMNSMRILTHYHVLFQYLEAGSGIVWEDQAHFLQRGGDCGDEAV
ncbi:hypothetical protein JHK87_044636 [Glycine soja]|nr:hypothetical protein JHK87_044636 [Glycine soja]